ncbi:MAG TPA: 50S ribosomal protein L25 [Candidatus Eremiobacteraceae bacterium]|nr:50S ribosomal protein L25 [Candidatus Eremiobacteraceae bacterium]
METVNLSAKPRTQSGTRAASRLRGEHKIPAVVYGREFGDALPITIDAREFRSAMSGKSVHSIINLTIEGRGTTPVLLHERQDDVISKRPIHLDLHAVNLNEEVDALVKVIAVGTAAGVKNGGILDLVAREVDVRALPANVPDHLEIDVRELEIGQALHVRDLVAPEGVTITADANDIVVSVLPPAKVEEPVVAEAVPGAAPAEPELIGAKKPDEEPAE